MAGSYFETDDAIFVRSFRHYRSKKMVYAKNGEWIRIPKARLKKRSGR